VPLLFPHPVDTHRRLTHCAPVKKKPAKIEEPKAAYAAKKPAKAAALPKKTDLGEAEFKRITSKLFTERKELLHKLAQ
jgi:hypothetical protein